MDGPAPIVSIVVCFLDEARFLDGAIETVRAQTMTDWELILVDDGSTDDSPAIAEGHRIADDGRIMTMTHAGRVNRGLPASRNLGLSAARGAFVAFLDADDRWDPTKLYRQVDVMRSHHDAVMTCGATLYRDVDGREPATRVAVTADAPVTFGRGAFARALLNRRLRPPPPSDVLYRADALRAVGGVPSGDSLYEDQRTFVAVSLRGPVHVTDDTLTTYALRDDSLYGSLHTDAVTRERQRRTFERWVIRYAVRAGREGRRLAAALVVDRVRRRWRRVIRARRRWRASR